MTWVSGGRMWPDGDGVEYGAVELQERPRPVLAEHDEAAYPGAGVHRGCPARRHGLQPPDIYEKHKIAVDERV